MSPWWEGANLILTGDYSFKRGGIPLRLNQVVLQYLEYPHIFFFYNRKSRVENTEENAGIYMTAFPCQKNLAKLLSWLIVFCCINAEKHRVPSVNFLTLFSWQMMALYVLMNVIKRKIGSEWENKYSFLSSCTHWLIIVHCYFTLKACSSQWFTISVVRALIPHSAWRQHVEFTYGKIRESKYVFHMTVVSSFSFCLCPNLTLSFFLLSLLLIYNAVKVLWHHHYRTLRSTWQHTKIPLKYLECTASMGFTHEAYTFYSIQLNTPTVLLDHILTGQFIRYTFLVLGLTPFCIWKCVSPLWHRLNKVLETFLRYLGPY